jgi:hypothetical protein
MARFDIFQLNFSVTPFYCFGLVLIDVLYGLKSVPSMVYFVIWQSASSSVEAIVLIEPVLASSGVIALSPNKSLNGVKPVDLETTMLWFHTTFINSSGHFPLG